jgi:hypothetical protein
MARPRKKRAASAGKKTVRLKAREVRSFLRRASRRCWDLTQEHEQLLHEFRARFGDFRDPEVLEALREHVAAGKASDEEREFLAALEQVGPDDGVSIAAYDPNRLLEVFPRIGLRPGFKLASYQFVSGHNGNGRVLVIPADRELPRPPADAGFSWPWDELDEAEDEGAAPGATTPGDGADQGDAGSRILGWASGNIERFLVGDGSPESFWEASVFAREVRELGAIWHGASWSDQHVLAGRKSPAGPDVKEADLDEAGRKRLKEHLARYEWHHERPGLWTPRIEVPKSDEQPLVVIFYTSTIFGGERVEEHQDRYPSWAADKEGRYECESRWRVLMTGPGMALH